MLFLFCLPENASAQEMTVDRLLGLHFEAKGGLERIKSIKTARMGGKLIMGPGNEAPFKMIFKRPSKIRTEFTVQGMVGIQAYDGKSGWALMPFLGIDKPTPANETQMQSLRDTADLDGPLVDWRQKGSSLDYLGQEEVGGKKVHKLQITRKNGETRMIYLDSETYLLVRQESTANIQGRETEIETIFSDYKSVEGVWMPHSIENRTKGSAIGQKTVVYTVELNLEVPDEIFAMPE
jgi:outer membrane lipoprotein-sorting protein